MSSIRTCLLVTEGIETVAEKDGKRSSLMVNRGPVVAEVLGFKHHEALSLERGK